MCPSLLWTLESIIGATGKGNVGQAADSIILSSCHLILKERFLKYGIFSNSKRRQTPCWKVRVPAASTPQRTPAVPVAFVQSPSALPMILLPVSRRIGGPMQPTGQANAMRGTAHNAGIGVSGRKRLAQPGLFRQADGASSSRMAPRSYPFFQPASLTPAQMLRYTAGSTRPSGRSGPHGCRAR